MKDSRQLIPSALKVLDLPVEKIGKLERPNFVAKRSLTKPPELELFSRS